MVNRLIGTSYGLDERGRTVAILAMEHSVPPTGNAVAADVADGKTFSSANGIGLTGTGAIATGDAEVTDVVAGKTFSKAGAAGLTGTAALPTGDAVAGDVADGKTFSNAAGVDLVGTNTNDAAVPTDGMITPPQAYVDCMCKFKDAMLNYVGNPNSSINWGAKGITGFDTGPSSLIAILNIFWNTIHGTGVRINLANNHIVDLNGIVARFAAQLEFGMNNGVLDIRNNDGTLSAQGLIDVAALVAAGWSVLHS